MLKIPKKRYPILDHEKSLKVFKEIDSKIKELELDYCITGGTLLGCIRHQGFIPWDDDIDLVVRHPHLEIIEHCIPDDWEVNKYDTNNKRLGEFLSLRKDDTIIDIWPVKITDLKMSRFNLQYSLDTAAGLLPIDWFYPLRHLKFEDFYVPAPFQPHLLLDFFFEDWDNTIIRPYEEGSMHEIDSLIVEKFEGEIPPLEELN